MTNIAEAFTHLNDTSLALAKPDADKLSDDAQLALFAFLLPKVELHAHLNGSISMALLRHLGQARIAATPSIAAMSMDDGALSKLTTAKERTAFCFNLFDCVYKIMDNLAFTRIATQDVILHYAAERTLFLELRTSLREGLRADPSPDAAIVGQVDYLRTVRDSIAAILSGTTLFDWSTGDAVDTTNEGAMVRWCAQLDQIYAGSCLLPHTVHRLLMENSALSRYVLGTTDGEEEGMLLPSTVFKHRIRGHLASMRCVLSVSISRSLPLSAARGTVGVVGDLIAEEAAAGPITPHSVPITSIDFSGNCYKQKFSDFAAILKGLRDTHQLAITLHAGEKDDDEELHEMIAFAPDRWGHLVFASDSARNEVDVRVKKPIELCPSSNLLGCGHEHVDMHHIERHWDVDAYVNLYVDNVAPTYSPLLDRAPISINTDDRGVFATSMTEELLVVASHRHIRCLPIEQRMRFLFTVQRRALEDGFIPASSRGTYGALQDLNSLFDSLCMVSLDC